MHASLTNYLRPRIVVTLSIKRDCTMQEYVCSPRPLASTKVVHPTQQMKQYSWIHILG